ncbi:hypothetical protein, partial [Pseudomonas aeruginosa]|uniref:hypothetical protein n=1 Tax=Pseudomonas aeruginosa TaxID=287 RepID=UPI0020D02A97
CRGASVTKYAERYLLLSCFRASLKVFEQIFSSAFELEQSIDSAKTSDEHKQLNVTTKLNLFN